MIGKAVSLGHKRYNVIILAGGAGSRMGVASDFIPKALTKLGKLRAIDFIIERYSNVAHKFIIGVGYHADLLTSYISGRYKYPIEFSMETPETMRNNAYSTLYCLDHADSRYGTIVTFCDLVMLDNLVIDDDCLYYVNENTKGFPGTFRHSLLIDNGNVSEIIKNTEPTKFSNGVLGTFVFGNTPLLKANMYAKYSTLNDLTDDGVVSYLKAQPLHAKECSVVYEFGNEDDLTSVRKLWQDA